MTTATARGSASWNLQIQYTDLELGPEKLTNIPAVATWLEHAKTTKRIDKYADDSREDLLLAAVREHILVQLDNLRTHQAVAKKRATEYACIGLHV